MINFRFEIVKQIGKGRSEVYLCRDKDLNGREVAVKFLSSGVDEEENKSFRNEYFTLRKLDHPNIISAFETGEVVTKDEHDSVSLNSKYIVLEYFESTELFEYQSLREEKNLNEILNQICSVLFYLHQSNYIYYDLKAENILVSSDEHSPKIKLIDLGLAEFIPYRSDHTIKGTAEYIAPELLKNEPHDYRVDLYSLGILLYRIIYQKLPFDSSDELSVYKAQVENEFDFPEAQDISNNLINVCKKLLEKDPDKRYQNSLGVITDLGFQIDEPLSRNFIPATVYSGRQDLINILSGYIEDKTSSEIFSVKGFDGAGKSALINNLYEKFHDAIIVSNTQGINGIELVKYIVKRMIFSPLVFSRLNSEEKDNLVSFTSKDEKGYLENLHSVISVITNKAKFLILIDDLNLFDSFVREIIQELIPVFQINGLKVVVSEASDFDYTSDNLNNVREVQVGSFTENQLKDYLQLAYHNNIPQEKIKDIILEYADLLPGNIINFIKDLIALKIISFNKAGMEVDENLDKLSGIEGSLSAIYNLRLDNLQEKEFDVAKLISAFEVSQEQDTLAELIKIELSELKDLLSILQDNNVIQPLIVNPVPVIVSDGLKKHIYSLIENKELFHRELAEKISADLPGFNKTELARQYELASDSETALKIWYVEIDSAFKLAAFSYARNLLNHLVELPIPAASENQVKYKQVETLYKLSDHNATLKTIDEVKIEYLSAEEVLELQIIKGSSLVGTGELEEGKALIESLIPRVKSESRKSTLLVEIAYATFDLNEFDDAFKLCNEILSRSEVTDEDRGRAHNLLGMCSYYKDNDFNNALHEFQKALEYYVKIGLKNKIAAVEVNIGVMYNIIGDKENAEASWARALELNRSVGNISQEGVLLLNNGAYYFDELDFEKAVEYYKRAQNIFLSLGGKVNEGIVLSNLGEVFFTTCEYQNSFDALEEARSIFEELENTEELVPVLVLLAHFYFVIGESHQLKLLFENAQKLIEGSDFHDKYSYEILLIKILMLIADEKDIDKSELESIRDNYLQKEDLKNYVTVNTILLNYLIKKESFSKVLDELNSESFAEVSKQNHIFEANREYLLGVVSSKYSSENTHSPIEHFEKAYELLKDEEIVEITWKVLYSLAVEYSKRGNINKAKQFIMYSRDLIQLIAENIDITNFKSAYLQKEERRNSIEQLEKLQEA